MSIKPTPGKWSVNLDGDVVDDNGNVIANVAPASEEHRERLANARMFAASKDLKHAAEHALAALRDSKDCEIVRMFLRSAITRSEQGD